jgi:hypothetical protein
MKATEFKKLIKESVREVIQEELKEILLEAVRSPKATVVTEVQPQINTPSPISHSDKKAMMEGIMSDMKRGQDTLSFNSTDAQGGGGTFNPQGLMPGGDLPQGNLGLDQIMGLMNK